LPEPWSYPDKLLEKPIIKLEKYYFCILLSATLGMISFQTAAGGLDIEQARHWIAEGKPADAYSLLEPYELEQAGNPEFDYLLGLSALNSGHPDKASIILERVLAVDPLYAAAWVDLGRAYILLGDTERARGDFKRAQELNPPPAALSTIRKYLDGMNSAGSKTKNQFSGYFEANTGHNNNVNNSTSDNQITVPILLNTQFILNPSSVKSADNYFGLAAGGEAVHPVSNNLSIYTGVDARIRSGLKYKDFDFDSLDVRAGLGYAKNAEQIRGGLVAGQFDQGGTVNRKSKGLNLEWKHTVNATNQTLFFGQQIAYRYPDPLLSSNDFYQTIAGLGWIHASADGRTLVSGSLFGGNERDTNTRIDGGKKIQGLRLSAQAAVNDKLEWYASAGAQWGQYDKSNSTFLIVREDHQADLSTGLNYRCTPVWVLRPQISLIRNQSNIVLDQYDQADISLTLRREFK